MEDMNNWADDVVRVPVVKWVNKNDREGGFMFTDTFEQMAKKDGISCVTFQFRKGHPEEAVLRSDAINCNWKEYEEVIHAIKNFKFENIKEDK